MNTYFAKVSVFLRHHWVSIAIVLFGMVVFSLFSHHAIEEKGGLSRLWLGVTSFFAGAAAGGFVGFLVGGIGIVAMGTGVGVPALAVAGFGALAGGVLFGTIGTGIGAYLSDPARYEVNQLMLVGILVASMVGSAVVVLAARRVAMWLFSRGYVRLEVNRLLARRG